MPPMDRRRFLAAVGTAAGAGLVLPACGLGSGTAIPEGEPELVLRQPSYELLTGQARRYAFLLVDRDNRPVEASEVDLYVADPSGEVVDGPFEAAHHEVGGSGLSVFRAHVDLPSPGPHLLVAVHDGRKGEGAVNVVDPADSAFPAPGDPAVAVATPTTTDDRGYARVCTGQPPCGMHEADLEAALADGRPVLLFFATPAYCQTAVCGPAVSVADAVRADGSWSDDLAWIHAEIYTDEGATVADPVREWNLPSEPWAYAIDREGRVAERFDGPLVAEDVRDLAATVA